VPIAPRYEPQVQQSGLPAARVSGDAPLSTFGGGQEGMSTAVSNMNKEVMAIVQKEKQKADDTATKGIQIQAVQIANDEMYNSKNGAITKQGKAAFGANEEHLSKYDKRTSELLSNLTSDQKPIAQMIIQQHRGGLETDLHKHTRSQAEALEDETFKTLIATNRNDAVLHYDDMDRISTSIDTQTKAIKSYAEDNGKDSSWADMAVIEASSKTHSGVIETMLSNSQDRLAKKYYDANLEGIDGDTRKELSKKLKDGTLKGDAQRMADQYISKSENMSEALSKIPKGNVDLHDETQKRIVNYYQLQDAARKQEKSAANQEIDDFVRTSVNIHALHSHPKWDMLSDSEKGNADSAMMAKINGSVKDSNRETLAKLDAMTIEELTATDLTSPDFKYTLNDSDYKHYSQMKSKALKGDTKDFDGHLSKKQSIDFVLGQAGLKVDKDSPTKTNKYYAVSSSINKEIAAQATLLKRQLTPDEMEKIAQKQTTKYILSDGWFSSPVVKYHGEFKIKSKADEEALQWAKEHPDDPRTKAIYKRLEAE
jgi:hypothetical protein